MIALTIGILTAGVNFGNRPLVGVTVSIVSLASLVLLMIVSGEWGRRGAKENSTAEKK